MTGAIALAEVLAESKHLTHLDLKDNDVRVAGLMALQLGHRMNQTLLYMETPKSYKVEQVRRRGRGVLCERCDGVIVTVYGCAQWGDKVVNAFTDETITC